MDPDVQVNAYRERLHNALRHRAQRRIQDPPGDLQVFVNGESVGTVKAAAAASPALVYASRDRAIQSLEFRSPSGLLLAGFTGPEAGTRTARFEAPAGVVEVGIHNAMGGGSVSVTTPAAGWRSAARLGAEAVRRLADAGWLPDAWPRLALSTALAALLLSAVLFRPGDPTGPAPGGPPSSGALDRLDHRLADIAEAQTATYQALRAQQDEIARMHRTVDQISGMQRQLRGNVVTVEHRVRTVNRDLAAAKRALAQDVAALQIRNNEIKERLISEVVTLSKARLPEAVEASGQPPRPLAARQDEAVKSLSFWVSFQEGTPEKNIDEFLQQLQGQRGPVSHGWQKMQVPLQQPLTSEAVLESVRKAKIIRAVSTTPPADAAR